MRRQSKVAARLGKYVHYGLIPQTDLEDAILAPCGSNGTLSKYKREDLCKEIRNGLKKAKGDSLPPLARPHAMDRSGACTR
jgi:hypothetical protein